MRQNTQKSRGNLPFQCFHTCAAPGDDFRSAVLYVRGVNPARLAISLVSFPEHEPREIPMAYTGSTAGIHRFDADLKLDHGTNRQRYCFKIALRNSQGQIVDVVWYSSLGMERECPLLHHCFAFELNGVHPEWAYDLILYQIVPDRFASSAGHFTIDAETFSAQVPIPVTTYEYKDLDTIHCGGDLDGITDMIPYLNDLGINGLTLTSIFKAPSPLKDDTEDYDLVDARLGGNGALKRLRQVSMGYEMSLILSGSFAYTGDNHPWFDRRDRTGTGALHHEDSPYRDHYTFIDYPDGTRDALYFHGNPQLPKLDYGCRQVRHAIYKGPNSVIRKWLRPPYGADGWCLDGGPKIGDGGSARNHLKRLHQFCKAARSTHEQCLVLAKFTSDPRYALNSAGGVDGVVDYTGFLSPVRSFFAGRNLQSESTPYTGEDLRRTCENFAVGLTQQTKLCLINELDNQDLPRFFTLIDGDKALYKAALAAMFAWRGIPSLYQGDELGDVIASHQIGPRAPLPFLAMREHHASPYSAELQQLIHRLSLLRRKSPALTRGTQVFVCAGGAHFGFLRIYADSFALIFVNAARTIARIEPGSMLLPLLATRYASRNAPVDESPDGGQDLLIPLSGREVRRTDHAEGLEELFTRLKEEIRGITCIGAGKDNDDFRQSFLNCLCTGKTLLLPQRSTVIITGGK